MRRTSGPSLRDSLASIFFALLVCCVIAAWPSCWLILDAAPCTGKSFLYCLPVLFVAFVSSSIGLLVGALCLAALGDFERNKTLFKADVYLMLSTAVLVVLSLHKSAVVF